MRVRVWGVRGSQASPGPDTAKYGGNTSCYDAQVIEGSLMVLDAGTGIRLLGNEIGPDITRVDILLTHLHMDHIQGLGFFAPMFRDDMEVHVWGPGSTTMGLAHRLGRYLSPPLFPVRLRDLPCDLHVHDLVYEPFDVPGATVTADLVCHPGPTCGFRIESVDGAVLAYLPDHEPALGSHDFPNDVEWTSGINVAEHAHLLLHDAQYRHEEYRERVGWGHSQARDALLFAAMAEVEHVVLTHHDPGHSDTFLDGWIGELAADAPAGLKVSAAREGDFHEL